MNKVYVGTSLLNIDRAKHIIARLKSLNLSITYEWPNHGMVADKALLPVIARNEVIGVRECDVFFMIQPGRSGTHIEFGMAYALGKPIVMLNEDDEWPTCFYHLPGVHRFSVEDDAIAFLLKLLEQS